MVQSSNRISPTNGRVSEAFVLKLNPSLITQVAEFDDEEARQIDGLNAENARPWATNVESQAPAHAAVGG